MRGAALGRGARGGVARGVAQAWARPSGGGLGVGWRLGLLLACCILQRLEGHQALGLESVRRAGQTHKGAPGAEQQPHRALCAHMWCIGARSLGMRLNTYWLYRK